MALIDLTAAELLAELASGRVSAVEVAAGLPGADRPARRRSEGLPARRSAGGAGQRAEEIDRRRAAGQPLGRLAGLPVAVKDLLCTAGEPTTCASRMLENFRPPYDATVVARLKAADAVLIGKTNMDEFAMGGSTENSAFQLTRNPWDLDADSRRLQRRGGGLRGRRHGPVVGRHRHRRLDPLARPGCAASRGMKPTYGRVSRYGLVAFASSLDQIGPLARTAEDAALLLEVLAGHDPLDSTSIDLPVPPYSADASASRWRVCGSAWSASISAPGWTPRSRRRSARRSRVYESLGATVEVALAAARQVRRGHLLRHRPLRGLQQPGPLRRRALRLSHRREADAGRVAGRAKRAGEGRRQARRWTSSTIRWSACIAAAGPRVSGRR